MSVRDHRMPAVPDTMRRKATERCSRRQRTVALQRSPTDDAPAPTAPSHWQFLRRRVCVGIALVGRVRWAGESASNSHGASSVLVGKASKYGQKGRALASG
jgi:hypothetical protein